MHAHQIENGFAILFSTALEAPDLEVTLIQYGIPVQIPATGGSFDYNIEVENLGASTVVADIWCDVTLPNGSGYSPVLDPVNLTLAVGFRLARVCTQIVPVAAPSGTYI